MNAYFNLYLLFSESNKNRNNINSFKSISCQKPVPREINIQKKINNNNKNQIIPLVL